MLTEKDYDMQNCLTCRHGICFFCAMILVIISGLMICFGLPVTQFMFANKYENEITCHTDIVNIHDWLIVDGCIIITILISFLIERTTKYYWKERNYYTELCIIMFGCCLELPIIAWTVIGSIIFWNDCMNVNPLNIRILMWISLIFSYFGIIILTYILNDRRKHNKKIQSPKFIIDDYPLPMTTHNNSDNYDTDATTDITVGHYYNKMIDINNGSNNDSMSNDMISMSDV